jgi:hypothetical protein
MTQPTPLAGLTADQADEAISRLAQRIDEQEASLKAAKAHLKDLRAARKNLQEPEPPGEGVVVTAQTAEVAAEAQEVGS